MPKLEKLIKIGGREITVHRATLAMSIHEQFLRESAIKSPVDNVFVQTVRVIHMPTLMAFSTGDLPTEEEFLEMSTADVEKWYEAVVELNPTAFAQKGEKEEIAKKKD